jgi:hypothetical protein
MNSGVAFLLACAGSFICGFSLGLVLAYLLWANIPNETDEEQA